MSEGCSALADKIKTELIKNRVLKIILIGTKQQRINFFLYFYFWIMKQYYCKSLIFV